jgi:hypothetical protein
MAAPRIRAAVFMIARFRKLNGSAVRGTVPGFEQVKVESW